MQENVLFSFFFFFPHLRSCDVLVLLSHPLFSLPFLNTARRFLYGRENEAHFTPLVDVAAAGREGKGSLFKSFFIPNY